MKTKLLALLLLAGSSVFAAPRVFVGVNFGVGGYYAAPPPRPAIVEYAAPAPGPEFTYINGYYAPGAYGYAWHGGYWARRPFYGARWVAPRYYGHRYYGGYWRR